MSFKRFVGGIVAVHDDATVLYCLPPAERESFAATTSGLLGESKMYQQKSAKKMETRTNPMTLGND